MVLKEKYYSSNTINKQAEFFCEKIAALRSGHSVIINPSNVALLVIDMQDYFVCENSHAYIPSIGVIIPRIQQLQEFCIRSGICVIHTCHQNTSANAKMMTKWWGSHTLMLDDPSAKITAKLAQPEIPVVYKTQYDAFYNSDLETTLNTHGIKQLIITGVMAHLCCETTARVAFTRGYEVFFSIDATATYNREFHLATLTNLAHGFCVPMLCSEIIEKLSYETI